MYKLYKNDTPYKLSLVDIDPVPFLEWTISHSKSFYVARYYYSNLYTPTDIERENKYWNGRKAKLYESIEIIYKINCSNK